MEVWRSSWKVYACIHIFKQSSFTKIHDLARRDVC